VAPATLLEAVDAPFDGVALLVGVRVEAGRAAALAAPPKTVGGNAPGMSEPPDNIAARHEMDSEGAEYAGRWR
jgi:hypothetical protein